MRGERLEVEWEEREEGEEAPANIVAWLGVGPARQLHRQCYMPVAVDFAGRCCQGETGSKSCSFGRWRVSYCTVEGL